MPTGVYARSEEHNKKMSAIKKGKKPYKMTDEIRKNNSEAQKGKILSKEHKQKISNALKGRKPYEMTEITKRKISESNKLRKGEKSPRWLGGKSFESYTIDWTRTLKRAIRERDHYACQVCGKLQSDIAFDVHHIDYNKKNCNPENLVTLCRNCHSKTQSNRDYWMNTLKVAKPKV